MLEFVAGLAAGVTFMLFVEWLKRSPACEKNQEVVDDPTHDDLPVNVGMGASPQFGGMQAGSTQSNVPKMWRRKRKEPGPSL